MAKMRPRWAAAGVALSMATTASGCFLFDDGLSSSSEDDAEWMDPAHHEDPPPNPVEEPFEGECTPQSWHDEAVTAAPVSVEITGREILVKAPGDPRVDSVSGPGMFTGIGGSPPVVAFENATVDDALHGTLVLIGSSIQFGEGRLVHGHDQATRIEIGSVWVDLWTPSVADDTRPDLGPSADPGHQAGVDQTFRKELAAEHLEIIGYDQAYVVTSEEHVPLTGSFVVSATHLYMPHDSHLLVSSATARWDGEVFVGVTATGGRLTTEDGEVPGVPAVFLALDPHLQVGPDHVRTVEPAAIRVVMDEDGAILPSQVQLRLCAAPTIVMYAGQTRRLRMSYRQRDGRDAVLSDYAIDVIDGSGTWTGRIRPTMSVPSALLGPAQEHPEWKWGQGLIDFFDAVGEVAKAIGQGLGCVFTLGILCPDGSGSGGSSDDLAAYPGWMTPGAIGEFELELTAPYEAGTHSIQLHVMGDNYDALVGVDVLVYE